MERDDSAIEAETIDEVGSLDNQVSTPMSFCDT